MNEGTRSGKSTIRLLGISAERPTNGLYFYLYLYLHIQVISAWKEAVFTGRLWQAFRQKLKIGHDVYSPNSFEIIHNNIFM
jgi:hypothetical protein